MDARCFALQCPNIIGFDRSQLSNIIGSPMPDEDMEWSQPSTQHSLTLQWTQSCRPPVLSSQPQSAAAGSSSQPQSPIAGQSSQHQSAVAGPSNQDAHDGIFEELQRPRSRQRRASTPGSALPPVFNPTQNTCTGNSTRVGRRTWYNWEVTCKKLEWEVFHPQSGREHFVSSDVKWRRIQDRMLDRGITAHSSQLCGKWENIISGYKKVVDHNNKSGNEPYSALPKSERRMQRLPADFPEAWIQLLESFYGQHTTMIPPCMVESSAPLDNANSPSAVEEPVAADEPPSGHASDTTVRINSELKRKKEVSKSATAIVEAMKAFSVSLLEIESRRDSREDVRMTSMVASRDKMVDHLGLMAQAMFEMARNSRPVQSCSDDQE